MTEQSVSYTTPNGRRFWYLPSKGKSYLHCLNGPAYEGIHVKIWYIDNKYILIDEIEPWLKENNLTAPYSDEDQMAIMLRWG